MSSDQMEDALIAALIAERSIIRKEIRRCQKESQSLTARAEALEVELRAVEEAVEDRAAAREQVQGAAEESLVQRLDAQRSWNTRAEETLNKLTQTYKRKVDSTARMTASRATLLSGVSGWVADLQQRIAIQHSQDITDAKELEQLDTRLAHRQFEVFASVHESLRHGAALRELNHLLSDQRRQLERNCKLKLHALSKEQDRMVEHYRVAQQAMIQKRQPNLQDPVVLPNCVYLSREAISRSHTRDPGSPVRDDAIIPSNYIPNDTTAPVAEISTRVMLGAPSSQDPLLFSLTGEQLDMFGDAPAAEEATVHVVPLIKLPSSRTLQRGTEDNVSKGPADDGVTKSGGTTPRYSRGPTPRALTPKIGARTQPPPRETFRASNKVIPQPRTQQRQPAVPGLMGSATTLRKISPYARIQMLHRVQTPPSQLSTSNPTPIAAPVPMAGPTDGPSPYVGVRDPNNDQASVAESRDSEVSKSALTLRNALNTVPPKLFRTNLHRDAHAISLQQQTTRGGGRTSATPTVSACTS